MTDMIWIPTEEIANSVWIKPQIKHMEFFLTRVPGTTFSSILTTTEFDMRSGVATLKAIQDNLDTFFDIYIEEGGNNGEPIADPNSVSKDDVAFGLWVLENLDDLLEAL